MPTAVFGQVLFYWLAANVAVAADWPQILGPDRNGTARDERVNTAWGDGPAVVWERAVGEGFSGVAVAQGVAVLFHRDNDEEVVEGHDAETGKRLWKATFPARYSGGFIDDRGPRCTPVIHDGAVYLMGISGDLYALALKDGAKQWSRSVYKEFSAPEGYFGAGTTPIVEGDQLLVNVGGKNAGIVAFALSDGKPTWKSTDELASYSAPVATTVKGERMVIFVCRLNCVAIDPRNGAERFRIPFGQRGPTVNGASPLVLDGHLFLSASYGIGARWVRLAPDAAEVVWSNDETMSSQYATCVGSADALYGIDGRDDVGVARLRCFSPKTGTVHWTQDRFGAGTLILAGDTLLVLKTDGTLVAVAADPEQFRELASARILKTTTRALPALSNGRLYARDTRMLKCIDLRPHPAAKPARR